MKKYQRHMFTQSGVYLGYREVTKFDMIKPYLFMAVGLGIVISIISLVVFYNHEHTSRRNSVSEIEMTINK